MIVQWRSLPLIARIRWIRRVVPVGIILIVFTYQLFIALRIEDRYGHFYHYTFEIIFYSLVGPLVTWATLVWIENKIREKEKLEEQVRAQREQLAHLTSISPDAIITLDSNSHILSWNRGAEHLFEYTQQEVVGESIIGLLGNGMAVEALLESSKLIQDFETSVVTKSRQMTKISLSAAAIQSPRSDKTSRLLIIRDITAQKQRREILEEERQRISRDLHDSVAQMLYFIALKSDLLIANSTDPEQGSQLTEIAQSTRMILKEVRRTIFSLTTLDWESENFTRSLSDFIVRFGAEVGWELETRLDAHLDIPTRLQAVIFRVVQESMNNIAKHASASHVRVILHKDPGSQRIEMSITDNGSGFELQDPAGEGFGLRQMRKRVEDLKGALSIDSSISAGTTVRAVFPSNEIR